MNPGRDRTVRALAMENPAATQVFESLGIDYCCGGNNSLEEACRTANLNIDEVLDSLEKACEAAPTIEKDWQIEPIWALINHIKDTHHKYTRQEIDRLGPLFAKVCRVHGKNHPELLEISESFEGLAAELSAHLMKEEMILFPYLTAMEAAATGNASVPRAPLGSVQNPISMMEHEHDSAGHALSRMRAASKGYSTPPDACISYQTLYKALAELNPTFISIFIWRTTFYFPVQFEWRAQA
jgi:regulator of cell morphogenesis and NO signaling